MISLVGWVTSQQLTSDGRCQNHRFCDRSVPNVDFLFIFFLCCCRQRAFQASKIFSRGSAFSLDTASTTAKFLCSSRAFHLIQTIKSGEQVRLLDITQREHFIFTFDGNVIISPSTALITPCHLRRFCTPYGEPESPLLRQNGRSVQP